MSYVIKGVVTSSGRQSCKFMSMRYLTIKGVIQGYHTYKNVWNPSVSEELTCKREGSNEKKTTQRLCVAWKISAARSLSDNKTASL